MTNARLVELIIERFPRNPGHVVKEGVVRKVSMKGGFLVIEGPGKTEMDIKLGKETPLSVNGKEASLTDVHPGMRIRVYENAKGEVISIETWAKAGGTKEVP